MIFRITRASRWTNEKAPIEEAKMIDAELRFLDKKIWVIEIDGLDEMMSLFDKYGALVLTESDYWVNGKQLNEIIIYDDYIE